MLRRLTAAFITVAALLIGPASLVPAFAAVDAAYCDANPGDPDCVGYFTNTTHGGSTPPTDGTHTADNGSASDPYLSTCKPPVGPLMPFDVDCWGCRWSAASVGDMHDLGQAKMADAQQKLTSSPGSALYRVDCYEPGVGLISTNWLVTTSAPPIPGVPATQMAHELVVHIRTPLPLVNTSPGTETYVRLSTFMWVPADQWVPVLDTKGDAWKTVTLRADPYQVKWNMGDHVVTCNGPGEPYNASGPDDQTTSCMYTYTKTSAEQPGLAYKVSATIFFKLTWTCTGACDAASGKLNDKQMWSSSLLKVAERQAVVTSSGGGN